MSDGRAAEQAGQPHQHRPDPLTRQEGHIVLGRNLSYSRPGGRESSGLALVPGRDARSGCGHQLTIVLYCGDSGVMHVR